MAFRCSTQLLDILCALAYFIGSLLYVAGSAMFLPTVNQARAGAWSFVAGSVLFVLGGTFNAIKLGNGVKNEASTRLLRVSYLYVWGSVAFLVGSVLFLPDIDNSTLGAWLFIIGSGLFLVGMLADLSESYKIKTTKLVWCSLAACLMNVLGSLVFMFASIPYVVLDLASATAGSDKIFEAVTILFIFGTVCFLSAGAIALVQACASRSHQSDSKRPNLPGPEKELNTV